MNANDVIGEKVWKQLVVSNDLITVPITDSKSTLNMRVSSLSKTSLGMSLADNVAGQVQKKIIPWTEMFKEQEKTERLPCHPDFILIASLIDRAPNLGGLSRTCEIFGVGKLIVNNMKITEDKEFLNTSVTAHQWIDMEEVKGIESLKNYLEEMKLNGYAIIGTEQTSESQKLHEFQFPKKSVIVLGNEKEGIPVELIQVLDVCVEIPQTGLIRSLNVHVSGAIVVWEYVRQQLTKK